MRVLFHTSGFGYRGTDVATYDYALFNREILGNESYILAPGKTRDLSVDVYSKFRSSFPIFHYDGPADLERAIGRTKSDVFYCLKGGFNDGISTKSIKMCVHCVFRHTDFHGDVYAYISNWLAAEMTGGKQPFVPHVVHLPEVEGDLRASLGIPKDAIVFGRSGGLKTFNLRMAHAAVRKISAARNDVYFLFLNTEPVRRGRLDRRALQSDHIIYLPPTTDLVSKVLFINTCDAMLHARSDGETFGLAVAEFSIKNKPVFTYSASEDKAHIQMLGEKGLLYDNADDLFRMLMDFRPDPSKNWDAYSRDYNPKAVMAKFEDVFLK